MRQDIEVHLGKRLYERRRQLGLTQSQLGERCGVSFRQIHKYECAENRISASRIWVLANALDVPVAYFYERIEAAASPSQGQ